MYYPDKPLPPPPSGKEQRGIELRTLPMSPDGRHQPMIQELLGQIEDLKADIEFRQRTNLERVNHELERENQALRSRNQDLEAEMCTMREALKSIRSVVFTTGLKISANARDRKRKSSGVTEIVSEPQEEAQDEAEQAQVPIDFI